MIPAMENYWEANLRVIESRYPGLAEQLRKDKAPEGRLDIQVESSAAGAPTLVAGGIHAHSPRDPLKEGRRLAETLSGEGPLIILGFGLGYAAEAASEKRPDSPLIIVERRAGVLRKALETRNFENLFGSRKIVFMLGGESAAITGALQLFSDPGGEKAAPGIIRNRALMSLDEEWYTEIEGHIKTWISRDDVNMATLRRFGKRWVRNLVVNMEAIRDLPGISRLEGCLKRNSPSPFPVLLAAAGPSLDRMGPFLGAIAERCVIVAVDTSLRFLLRAGVDPDFAVVVDPQYWNALHLDRVPAPRTCLIAESAVYPPVLRHPFRRAFLCGSLFPLGRFIEDRLDPKGALGAGGSVATTAWDFVRVLGGNPVWIAGLDLAFPGLKTHFKGALFEERALTEGRRLTPAETFSLQALRDGRPFRASSAQGEPVLTDRRLALYAAWFENRFRQFPQVLNYRLSGEGLAIPGLKSSPVEDILALPPRRDGINRTLEAVYAGIEADFRRPGEAESREKKYRNAGKELLRELGNLKDLAEKGTDLAEGAFKRIKNPKSGLPEGENAEIREKVLKKLDALNRAVETCGAKDVAGFLFPPASELEEKLTIPQSEPLKRHLEFSAKFYRALAEAAEYNIRELGRSRLR
jgi:hypothetical protein